MRKARIDIDRIARDRINHGDGFKLRSVHRFRHLHTATRDQLRQLDRIHNDGLAPVEQPHIHSHAHQLEVVVAATLQTEQPLERPLLGLASCQRRQRITLALTSCLLFSRALELRAGNTFSSVRDRTQLRPRQRLTLGLLEALLTPTTDTRDLIDLTLKARVGIQSIKGLDSFALQPCNGRVDPDLLIRVRRLISLDAELLDLSIDLRATVGRICQRCRRFLLGLQLITQQLGLHDLNLFSDSVEVFLPERSAQLLGLTLLLLTLLLDILNLLRLLVCRPIVQRCHRTTLDLLLLLEDELLRPPHLGTDGGDLKRCRHEAQQEGVSGPLQQRTTREPVALHRLEHLFSRF